MTVLITEYLLELALQIGVDLEEYRLDARRARDDDGEVVFDNGADHHRGEAVGEIGLGGLFVDEIDAGGAGGYDETAESEKAVYGDTVRAPEAKVPGEDYGHDVEDEVVYQHEYGVEVAECVDVDAAAFYRAVPHLLDGQTLEDDDGDAGEAKSEGEEVHNVYESTVPALKREFCVEE